MMHTGQRSASGLAQDISDVTGVFAEENQHIIESLKQGLTRHADFSQSPQVDDEDSRSRQAELQSRIALRRRLAERFPRESSCTFAAGILSRRYGDSIC